MSELEGYKVENHKLILKIASQEKIIKGLQNKLQYDANQQLILKLENEIVTLIKETQSLKAELHVERNKPFLKRIFCRVS